MTNGASDYQTGQQAHTLVLKHKSINTECRTAARNHPKERKKYLVIFPHSPEVPRCLSDFIPPSEGSVPGDSRVFEVIAPGFLQQDKTPNSSGLKLEGSFYKEETNSGAATAASFSPVELVPVWTNCPEFSSSPSILNGLLGKVGEEELLSFFPALLKHTEDERRGPAQVWLTGR